MWSTGEKILSCLAVGRELNFKSLGRFITQVLKGWRPEVDLDIAWIVLNLVLACQDSLLLTGFEQQPKICLVGLSPYNARVRALINLSFLGQCDAGIWYWWSSGSVREEFVNSHKKPRSSRGRPGFSQRSVHHYRSQYPFRSCWGGDGCESQHPGDDQLSDVFLFSTACLKIL